MGKESEVPTVRLQTYGGDLMGKESKVLCTM